MEQIIMWLRQPWPWYVAGPLIGLTVPLLLILGNKTFGISSSLRHVCAACIPAKIPFFTYEWKKEKWNLVFALGILLGGFLAMTFLRDGTAVTVHPHLVNELSGYGIKDYSSLIPADLFNWQQLFTWRGVIMMVGGGFLVGFGTRYAGGCTSGHSIMGLSSLQWPSLVATCCFMAGGFIMANLILPFILSI
ncbi:YeeE/YedE family protein [Chitinophaga sp. sic0106]|uniref:YeeE/YedE family protein n=1 Tax=Chitinophaga sp. sic0106 TaxID=2854785 RepID=UPI001C475415|nr:YeeE/YedE thiosulfate transporter family protein [Chitinophaga sp. sic0106]MBV7529094.1 YeeE/YedE family protein [Chitinophaga sp. sic0106]